MRHPHASACPPARRALGAWPWVSLALVSGLAAPAHAALGGAYGSVEADRAHMAARMSSAQAANYSVHTLALPNGGVAKEYARADGSVFGVSWRGPGRPDLRQLLGASFDRFQSDNALQHGRRARKPLTVDRSDLVVRNGGHPGGFWGMAYLPNLAPTGFSTRELK